MGNTCLTAREPKSKYASAGKTTRKSSLDAYQNREVDSLSKTLPQSLSPPNHNGPLLAMARKGIGSNCCVTAGEDGTIAIYNYQLNRCFKTWSAHSSDITSLCISSDEKLLFSASRDKSIKVWSVDSYECKGTLLGHDLNPAVLECRPHDNNMLVSGSRDNTVRLWDIQTSTCTSVRKIERNLVTDLCFINNDSFLQTSEDLIIRFWDARSLDVIQQYVPKMMTNIPTCVAISPDGNQFLTGHKGFSKDSAQIIVWDRRTCTEITRLNGHTMTINKVGYLSDGRIVSIANDRTIRLWESPGATTHMLTSPLYSFNLEDYRCESPLALFIPTIGKTSNYTCNRRDYFVVGGFADFCATFEYSSTNMNFALRSIAKSQQE